MGRKSSGIVRKKTNIVGKMLKDAREKLHLQQQKVASCVDVTPAYICKLEKGINPPSAELCIKLAQVLKLDEVELQRWALAEREGLDLQKLISSIKKDPLAGLTPDEAKLVRGWRKLDDYFKDKVMNFIKGAQESLEIAKS